MGVLYWGIAGVQREMGRAETAFFRGFVKAASEGISAALCKVNGGNGYFNEPS